MQISQNFYPLLTKGLLYKGNVRNNVSSYREDTITEGDWCEEKQTEVTIVVALMKNGRRISLL